MFIKKATGTLEVHKNLQRAAHKNYVEKEIKKILGDLNGSENGSPQAIFSEK